MGWLPCSLHAPKCWTSFNSCASVSPDSSGPPTGDAGDRRSVHGMKTTTRHEKGVCVCHSCGREGSVYTFLIDELGYSKKQAYYEIHGTAPEPQPEKKKDKPYVWPQIPPKSREGKPRTAVHEYRWSNADFRMRYQAGYDLANARRGARERGEAIVRETRKAGALL